MTEGTARAKIKNNFINVDKDGLAKNIGKVLISDDDSDYTDLINRNLSQVGFVSETVNSFAQMESALESNHYSVILCDNIEGNPELKKAPTGSQLILEKPELFKDSKVVLVTGWATEQIEKEQELKNRGIEILEKGEGHVSKIIKICEETFSAGANDIANQTQDYLDKLILNYKFEPVTDSVSPYEKLIKRTKLRFRKYIDSLPNQDLPQFYIKGKSLSPKQIIAEIEKDDSDIGILLIDILLDDVLEEDDD